MTSWRGPEIIALLGLTVLAPARAATTEDAPGVPRFEQVSANIYRGGQPSLHGFRSLARLGIKTVVDLRMSSEQAGWEKRTVEDLGMRYVHVPMHSMIAPSDEQVSQVLSVLGDSNAWPVFVHCAGGVDRTGVVVACYRITHDHWTNEKALDEARRVGIRSVEAAKWRYILTYHPRIAE